MPLTKLIECHPVGTTNRIAALEAEVTQLAEQIASCEQQRQRLALACIECQYAIPEFEARLGQLRNALAA